MPGERTVGFSVDDLGRRPTSCEQLVSTSTTRSPPRRFRYVHFGLPDGRLYELVEINSG